MRNQTEAIHYSPNKLTRQVPCNSYWNFHTSTTNDVTCIDCLRILAGQVVDTRELSVFCKSKALEMPEHKAIIKELFLDTLDEIRYGNDEGDETEMCIEAVNELTAGVASPYVILKDLA